jgi:hypothetical protein
MRLQKFVRYAAMTLCAGVFIGGSSVHVIRQVKAARSSQEYPARNFAVTLLEYRIDALGTKTLIAVRVKEVNTDGTLTETVSWVVRKKQMTIHRDAHGVVVKDGKTDRMVQNWDGKKEPEAILNLRSQARTTGYYEKHHGLIGTEIVAGLKAYTIRANLEELRQDVSYSPETGDSFIKLVHYNSDGSKVLVEAVKIEFK